MIMKILEELTNIELSQLRTETADPEVKLAIREEFKRRQLLPIPIDIDF